LFKELYDLVPKEDTEEHEVELIKLPPNGYYEVMALKTRSCAWAM
jgi:type III restriction enzyme